jgi:putative hemolysin
MGRYLGQIITILILIVLNGYFVAAEMSLVSARRTALRGAADKGSAGARTALRLLDDPNKLLSTISVAITLFGFTAASLAAVTFEGPMAVVLRALGLPFVSGIASGLAVFFVTVAITYVTLVFAELAPKRLALQHSERVAQAVARPVLWLSVILGPVVWILGHSTDVVARLLGVRANQSSLRAVSEEEIKMLVSEQGTLLDEEKRMIGEVLEIGGTVAREVMVPRVDVQMIDDELTIGEALPIFRSTGFSRMPVYHEDADTIVGLALLKDLLGPIATGSTAALVATTMREPWFVPETKPILDLLQDMRSSHNHMVVVVDEHGGTAGIVTIEDIVEEVIGDIVDEFDRERRYVSTAGDGEWLVDGRLDVEDANDRLGLHVPVSEEYDTLAGWVLSELGHIPVAGETIEAGDVTVRVEAVRRRRIARLRIALRSAGAAPAHGAPVGDEGGTHE